MTASSGSSPKPGPRPSGDGRADDAVESATAKAKDAIAGAKDSVGHAADTAAQKAREAGEQARDAAETAREKVRDAVASAKEKAADRSGSGHDVAEDARHKAAAAKDKAADVKDKAAEAKDNAVAETAAARDAARDRAAAVGSPAVAAPARPREDVPLTKPLRPADDRAARTPPPVTAPKDAGDPDESSIGQLVTTATEAMSTLVRSEIELAKLELRSSIKNARTGIGLFVAALVVLVFSLTFGFITLAEGIIALGLSRWLGYLIVFGFLFFVVLLFAFIGFKKVKAVRGPERTIKVTKETVGYFSSHKSEQG